MRKNKKRLELGMTFLILAGAFYIGRLGAQMVEMHQRIIESAAVVEEEVTEKERITVVVDAGHGGIDSGKVGIGDVLEKDINLAISQKLKALLEEQGIEVVMTRETDGGLYEENESNKKQQDMKRRCELIDSVNPAVAVSIHQNSYTQESVHGPQVFYYKTSAQGEQLAKTLQEALNTGLQVDRPREIKPNDTYYLLRKTSAPTVIVECGFLSNAEEAAKLETEEHQQKVAEAVCRGIMDYLEAL